MEIALQRRLIVAAGLLLAVVLGWNMAEGDFLLPLAISGVLILFTSSWLLQLRPDVLVVGVVLAGYLIGNRGFAQLHPPGVPLLPGEFAIALGVALALWRCAMHRVLPIRADLLNFAVLAWALAGVARLRFDVRAHGWVALRDFTTVYYAVFFYLAQLWAGDERSRQWLNRCLNVGFALCAPAFLAFSWWPETVQRLTVLGTPLIFVKSDVAGGLMVAGAYWFLERHVVTGRRIFLLPTALNLAGVALSNSRAALVALLVTGSWLVLRRSWRRVRPLAWMCGGGVAALLLASVLLHQTWRAGFGYRLYESVASTLDFSGTGRYRSVELGDKADNNQFRTTWWKIVIDETVAQSPWTGLGFGADLTDQFLQAYYAGDPADFSARSPHSVVVTIFARMGVLGLTLLLAFLAVAGWRTWQALKTGADSGLTAAPLWLGAWAIFISACFGVVLEGPMAATVFWTLLGLANAERWRSERESESESDGERESRPEPAGVTETSGR